MSVRYIPQTPGRARPLRGPPRQAGARCSPGRGRPDQPCAHRSGADVGAQAPAYVPVSAASFEGRLLTTITAAFAGVTASPGRAAWPVALTWYDGPPQTMSGRHDPSHGRVGRCTGSAVCRVPERDRCHAGSHGVKGFGHGQVVGALASSRRPILHVRDGSPPGLSPEDRRDSPCDGIPRPPPTNRRHMLGSTFHTSGRSPPQKTHTKSSSRTMLCSRQPGQRRNTTSWVKPDGRPSPARSRAGATADHEAASGQYPVEWLLTSPTTHRSASWMKLISPALRTGPPPAQTTCSLRRGASRSTPSVPTTKVNGSARAVAGRSAIQLSKSAAEPIRQPPLSARTAAFSSAGPTYRYLRSRMIT
ncbi:hypothetical protein EES42_34700 [Streptomyces sp. ADI95-17]|nr:hypothetical protein EES42_34700 [Streptomyces sp. ADI95-17]